MSLLIPGVKAGMLPENNDEEVTVVAVAAGAFSKPPRTESPARQQTNLTRLLQL